MSEKAVTTYDLSRVVALNKRYFQRHGGDLLTRICGMRKGQLGCVGLKNGKPIFYSNSHLFVTDSVYGSGNTARAYHANVFAFNSDEVKERVIKVANRSFKGQAERLGQVPDAGETLDRFLYTDEGSPMGLAICHVSECNLIQVNYATEKRPVTFITGQVIDWADGILRLHRADLIHRDIKGDNLLVNHKKRGCVTDFGFLTGVDEIRSVAGSRSHTSPAIWDSIKYQLVGPGWQKKVDDLFAFGRTIQEDLLQHLIYQLARKGKLNGLDFSPLHPRKERRPGGDDAVEQIERDYPGRAMLCPEQELGSVTYWVYPDRGDVYQLTVDHIGRLEKCILRKSACEKLRRLAALARDLTSPVRSEICRSLGVDPRLQDVGDGLMAEVKRRLEAIQKGEGILVTEHSRYHLHSVIGEGESCQVWLADRYPITGGKPTIQVVKRSNESFYPQMQVLKKIGMKKTLDVIWEVFRRDKDYYGVFHLSKVDLSRFSFCNREAPVDLLLRQAANWADGIGEIHSNDYVHRDITAENLLVNPEGPGKLTDFGLLIPLQQGKHFTLTTPFVAAGYIWDTLLDQYQATRKDCEEELGYHGKAADLFAFGRTLFSEVVVKMLSQLAKKNDMDGLDFDQFQPTHFRKACENEIALCLEIERLAIKYPNQIVMDLEQKQGEVSYFRFPPQDRAYQGVLAIIDQFEDVLSDKERDKLGQLAELATGLLSPTREGLCEFLEVSADKEDESDLLIREVKKRLRAILKGKERAVKRCKSDK